MRYYILLILYLITFTLSVKAQGVGNLNNLFSTYSQDIKTDNPLPGGSESCIYAAKYMTAQQYGSTLILSFGFGWDESYGYIYTCELKINLSTSIFCTGYWDNWLGPWKQYGKKEEITISDKNGMDLTLEGQQNYNRGTKKHLIEKIKISMGSIPLANKVLTELYSLQSGYKSKEPWLLPQSPPQSHSSTSYQNSTVKTNTLKQSGVKKNNNRTYQKKTSSNSSSTHNKKRVGKYVQ